MSEETYAIDVWIAEARVRNRTTQAIRFIYKSQSYWIPYSLVHDDSEAYDVGHSGRLLIPLWKAQELGLAPEPKRKPLPKKGERERQVVSAVVRLLKDKARALYARSAVMPTEDLGAICECGACDPADPIGWHEAAILERAATEIESTMKS